MIIGIDNGIGGAIAALGLNNDTISKCELYTFPIERYKIGKKLRSRYNLPELYDLIAKVCQKADFVVLEKAESRPGQSAQSTFSTGYGYGVIQAMLTVLDVPYIIVPARDWQKAIFKEKVADTKAASAKVATSYCDSDLFKKSKRATKLHDGKTDAFCIAMYGYLFLNDKTK